MIRPRATAGVGNHSKRLALWTRLPPACRRTRPKPAIDRPTKPPWSDFTRTENADQPLNGTFPYYSDGVAGEKYGAGNYKATNGRLYKVSTSGAETPLAWYPAPGFRRDDTGALLSVGNEGSVWSAAANGTYGVYLRFVVNAARPSNSDSRAYGFPLRCLSE